MLRSVTPMISPSVMSKVPFTDNVVPSNVRLASPLTRPEVPVAVNT
jgi:hypothetical protein